MSQLRPSNACSRREDRVFYEHGRGRRAAERRRNIARNIGCSAEERPEKAGEIRSGMPFRRRPASADVAIIGIFSRETSADPIDVQTESATAPRQ